MLLVFFIINITNSIQNPRLTNIIFKTKWNNNVYLYDYV